MNPEVKIYLALVFAFVLISGSIPFTTISRAQAQSEDNYYSDSNYPDFIKKFELPKNFNKPTPNDPYPNEIIPSDFPLRDACLAGKEIPSKYKTSFNIHAIPLRIVYNDFGFHDPNGRMYVLEEDKEDILQKVAQNEFKTVPEVQPLVIRTNVGKCVEIEFTNDLDNEYASIHPTGIGLDPNKSDGSFVGFNKDTTVAPGKTITYRWFPDVEGANFFSDAARQVVQSDLSLLGDWATKQLQSLRQHGLFGVLIVEAQKATWTDPFTGEPLRSGAKADIHYPDKIRKDTREFVAFYHDEAGVVDPFGKPTLGPNGKEITPMYVMNYRGDTINSRVNPEFRQFGNCQPGVADAICEDPDFFYNSWVHGDPGGGDVVFPAYSGDPIRQIIIGGQTEESHVHHLHEHRWKPDSSFGGSPTIDVQTTAAGNEFLEPTNLAFGDFTVNPDTTYAQALVAGAAGYQTGAPDDEHFTGDVIFHCHLFPHYGQGMWSLVRVLDRITSPFAEINPGGAQDLSGGNSLIPVGPVLLPLPDSNDNTPEADGDQPGFPYFIESNPDGSPKRPPDPNGGIGGRDYTDLEWRSTNYYQRALQNGENPNDRSVAKPGAPYDDPCPPNAPPRKYDIVAISDDVKYNKFGHHDPDGRIFVLRDEAKAILDGEKEPEPLILRAEMGECIQITFQNLLDPPENENFPVFEESTTLSMHTHFVGFDVLGSDGVVTGYDYMQGNKAPIKAPDPEDNIPGEKISYRWYADEQGNIFWHDHIAGIEKGFHGTGGMLVVEPPYSAWLDPETGQELEFPTSTEIMVAPEKGYEGDFEPFREFVMLLGDFQELFDKEGFPIMMQAHQFPNGKQDLNVGAPPQSSLNDHGVMSINYRNEPLWARMQKALTDTNLPEEAKDPANIFSSSLHGDPSTHIFKAYGNEPIKMRLLAASHEEMHNFVLNGLHPTGFNEFVTPFLGLQAQTIGVAEQFNFNFIAPVAVSARNDYMYSSFGTNDIFSGMWGLTRVWCNEQSLAEDPLFGKDSQNPVKLAPLPGVKPLDCSSPTSGEGGNNYEDNYNYEENYSYEDNYGQTYNYNNDLNNYENDQIQQYNNDALPFSPELEATQIVSSSSTPLPLKTQSIIQQQEAKPTTTATKLIQKDKDTSLGGLSTILQNNLLPEAEAQEDALAVDPNGPRTIIIPPNQDPQIPQISPPSLAPTPPSLAPISPTPATGFVPQSANELGISPTSCNPDAKKITYQVVALKKDIVLNEDNDKIPDGIFFVLAKDAAAVQNGQKPIEPLVIRANVGDCVVLELTNNLGEDEILPHDHPLQPGECNEHVDVACLEPKEWPTSNRVSLHADNVFYDVGAFDGTNIGFNPVDQTVGPGETITYEWQTVKTGINVLTDMGDLRGHRHHGGYGMLIVEPEGAKYLDINTKEPIESGPSADIVFPYNDEKNFREFAQTLGTSHYIITQENPTLCILPNEEEDGGNVPCNQSPINDPEDQGFPIINYRSEPFVHRLIEAAPVGTPGNPSLETSKIISQLLSSKIHGDPSTPILRVPEGKPTVLRIADVGDSVRGYSFHVAGHLMLRPAPISLDANDIPEDIPFHPYLERGTSDQSSVSRSFSLELVGGAGGLQDKPGDYLYQDQKLARSVEGGAWGILRVQPNIDPIKTVEYLLDDISYSELPDSVKELLTEQAQKILENLLSGDQTKIDEICSDIIPNLLKTLSAYESETGGYDSSNTPQDSSSEYQNGNTYTNYNPGEYSYDKDSEYNDEYYGQNDNGYYQKTLTLDKISEILRNIAYAVC